jgi:hypothetical protein
MTMRAHSTLIALQLLGNSIRGLDWARWCQVYNTIILPVLTYASPVWFTGQSSLLKELHVTQNLAIRHMAGAFRTTPVDPLHELMAILPISASTG